MTENPPNRGVSHVVLFGLPDAGKSALLGALVQAAQTQTQQLGSAIVALPEELAQLHKTLYDKGPTPTREAIISYTVMLEPRVPGAAAQAVFTDCSGAVAGELLAQKEFADAAGSELAQAIGQADTLIVVVDGSGDPAHLGKTFTQFAKFLRLLEQHRSERTEATGLPVYLVMTKCDLLAKTGDSSSAWMHRIEERKRAVHDRFADFLQREAAKSATPGWGDAAFGKLELHVWATAIGRPALADRPAKPTEPYGVAELFRQCLESAGEYRQRRQRASRRLQWAVAGAAALVVLLLALAVGFYATRPDPVVTALGNEALMLLPHPADKPALRLKEPLGDKLKKLKKIQDNPKFDQLPADLREQLAGYVAEIEAYQAYDKDFLTRVQPEPQYATRARDLDDIDKALSDVPLPSRFAESWKDTKVDRRHRQWRKDVHLLREAVARTEKWYKTQQQHAEKLYDEGVELLRKKKTAGKQERADWLQRVEEWSEQMAPHEPTVRIAGTSGITYAAVFNFDPVITARNDLTDFKNRQLDPLVKLVRGTP